MLLAMGVDSYLQFLTVLILFVFVLAVTWFVTRWIARYQQGRSGTGNLEIIETCRISPNKYIQIVRAGGKYLVIAIGKDEVHMLSEVPGEELVFKEIPEGEAIDFANILDRVKKMKEKDKG